MSGYERGMVDELGIPMKNFFVFLFIFFKPSFILSKWMLSYHFTKLFRNNIFKEKQF